MREPERDSLTTQAVLAEEKNIHSLACTELTSSGDTQSLERIRSGLMCQSASRGVVETDEVFIGDRHGTKPSALDLLSCRILALLDAGRNRKNLPAFVLRFSMMLCWFGRRTLAREGSAKEVLGVQERMYALFSEHASKKDKSVLEKQLDRFAEVEGFFGELIELVKYSKIDAIAELLDKFKALGKSEQWAVIHRVYESDLIGIMLDGYRAQVEAEVAIGRPTNTGDEIARLLFILVKSFGFPACGKCEGEARSYEESRMYHHAINRMAEFYLTAKDAKEVETAEKDESKEHPPTIRHRTYFR